MNKNFFLNNKEFSRKSLILFYLVPSLMVLLIACSKNIEQSMPTSNPAIEHSYNISDVINIVWTLESCKKGGKEIDLSSYEPFNLIYSDSVFRGKDGCNYFGGIYEIRGDSIIPTEVSMTEMLCNTKIFPIDHLTKPYRVQICQNKLNIYSNNSIYTYTTHTMNSIEDSPLIDKEWILQFSNAVEFDSMMQRLLFTLSFDINRYFEIKWYCSKANILGYNFYGGVYGIGNSHVILFYPMQWSYSHPDGIEENNDQVLAEKILKSSSYSIEDSSMILFNEIDNATFQFSSTGSGIRRYY